MAVICCTLIATFLIFFCSFSSPVKGVLEIVPPFPGQPVVIEGEKVRIPCVAQDLQNVTKPLSITFHKVLNIYGDTSPVKTGGGIKFESKFEMNGWRLVSYLVINNMTEALKHRYECHAARPQDGSGRIVPPAKYGFSIFYIPSVLEIVPPFPGQPVVIEGEKVRIPCVAQDLQNVTKPLSITFHKVTNIYGDTVSLKAGGDFAFELKFEMNGWRLVSYLVINNMTEALQHRYECHAARPQDGSGRRVPPAKYGFSIFYISKKNLPSLNHSKSVTTEFGKPASLFCQLVPAKVKVNTNIVKLDKIAWFKNNHVTGREQTTLEDKLQNINLTMNEPTDGGNYTCRLFTTLGLTRKYNISGVVEVKIKPKFQEISAGSVDDNGNTKTLDDNEIIRKKGKSAKFECLAKGNPIGIIWKMKPRDTDKTKVLNRGANMHYTFSDDTNRYQGFYMEIKEVNYDDRGQYRCCVEQSNSNPTELCQTFTLRVKDVNGSSSNSSSVQHEIQPFLVLITGVVAWLQK